MKILLSVWQYISSPQGGVVLTSAWAIVNEILAHSPAQSNSVVQLLEQVVTAIINKKNGTNQK